MRLRLSIKLRGQSSLEYMIMLALALGVFSVILVITNSLISSSSSQMAVATATRALSEIKEAADFIYVHGHPSKLQIKVYVPANIREVDIEEENNRTIYFRLDSMPEYTDVYAVTRGNITGNLTKLQHKGYYVLNLESIDNIWANISVE